MLYHPRSSLTPINIGLPLHVMRTSCSLRTVAPSLVKMEMVPSFKVLPTLNKDVGKLLNESACASSFGESYGNGSLVTCLPLLVPPFANPTRLVDRRRIGRPALTQSASLKKFPSDPE